MIRDINVMTCLVIRKSMRVFDSCETLLSDAVLMSGSSYMLSIVRLSTGGNELVVVVLVVVAVVWWIGAAGLLLDTHGHEPTVEWSTASSTRHRHIHMTVIVTAMTFLTSRNMWKSLK